MGDRGGTRAVLGISILTFAGACSPQSSDPPPPALDEGMTDACVGDAVPLIAGFQPAAPVDFLAFRVERMLALPPSVDAASDGWTATIEQPRGEPCTTATDRAACRARLDGLRLATSCGAFIQGTCEDRYLVFTRGDEVGTVERNDVVRFLFPIDTPEEAFYVASLGGLHYSCSNDLPHSRYRRDPNGGFDLSFVVNGGCRPAGSPIEHVLVHMAADGTTKEITRRKIGDTLPCYPDAS